jgi:hypothetical protein
MAAQLFLTLSNHSEDTPAAAKVYYNQGWRQAYHVHSKAWTGLGKKHSKQDKSLQTLGDPPYSAVILTQTKGREILLVAQQKACDWYKCSPLFAWRAEPWLMQTLLLQHPFGYISRLFSSLFESARRHPPVLPPSFAALSLFQGFSHMVFSRLLLIFIIRRTVELLTVVPVEG